MKLLRIALAAIRLWSGWGKLADLAAWLLRHPMAALALVLAIWGWSSHRAADKWQGQATKLAATLTAERDAAQAATRAAKAQSKKDAQDGDKNHTALVQGGDARFAAYAAAGHSLRENAPHRASPEQADDSQLLESPAPDAIMADISRVWVTRSDWLTCDADWAYAQAAHDWAKKVGE
ncbi:hypothetical protein [Novosphingobium sediminicola]|uniref:Uncharacterized protein n=1 Tax=Novosphingobium sediminicola TaxID=563162 RepID=A0A7W6CDE1_9SPHN|nr:hypothetical protein [Novosphingobium sediminicola]MBB3953400.1 hypothetical protein [Novosphingobium sediminicola]